MDQHCKATTKYLKLCHTQEEITWLDVEIWASIRDKGIHYEKVISQLSLSNPLLARVMSCVAAPEHSQSIPHPMS
jgi:2-polyprenyl-3-methyl-5-hydroxy-6-metoxy-1,4-benzoquinol methylase